ncbi:ABC transporter substrate-binding protein [Mycolicibacterium komossense]|uniref:Sugar ABC transporter substrate-binding protein n=1 Tax=Mycolicibacterium komossense TaxID=1779 RepID=A0ABT3C603_9MYCO|nr:sugar ABC transporter substrate-binding protein [Mycolicibacterium komossense]MCV7224903.1 sugar ABC transporter substrate-binding protein [Mycolicibacterium komossense]
MTRPRFSTLFAGAVALLAAVLLALAAALGYSSEPSGKTVITVRLWDAQVATAYRQSLDEFTRRHPGIEVRLDVVAYASYFDTLRTDVAGGGADDIFWISNAFLPGYADNGRLMPIQRSAGWEPSVVEQFSRDGTLWAVPQLTDAGIAVYYNTELLARAGVDPATLDTLRWDPDPAVDTLRPLLARLTGPRQWAYNAANDLQGIYLNYIGSAGGVFQQGDRFAFDNPQAATAFRYLVALINQDRVAPPAADTNNNRDFSRNQFLAGRMALFQSGTYNLAAIAEQAEFRWGVAMLPTGPAGRVSVTNGIAAAGNSATKHPEAVRQVLAWLGSTEGNAFVGAGGAAIPAVLAAQRTYFDYWSRRGVDVGPFFRVLDGPRIPAPGGSGFAAGYQAITPYFDEMFLGRSPVDTTLAQAQTAANAAASS